MLAILAAVMLAAAAQFDTVFTADGGRLLGTVVEEGPQGITVQLPDGTTRRFSRKDVTRIEYRDGSVSTPNRPAPPPAYQPAPAPAPAPRSAPSAPPSYQPPPPPTYPPPPAYPPPPPYGPPPYRPAPVRSGPYDAQGGMPPILPIYGVFGIGGLMPAGDAARNVRMDQVFDPQLDVYLEGGLRLNHHLALGMYVDVGVGDPSSNVRAEQACATFGNSCTATTGRVGVLLRHTFRPRDYSTPWLAIGTGYEWGDVTLHDGGGGSTQYFSYTGWEIARLMGGVDLRTNPIFGVGLYAGVGLGHYSKYTDALGDVSLPSGNLHWSVEGGLRFTLFP